jgi:hypothetical protein
MTTNSASQVRFNQLVAHYAMLLALKNEGQTEFLSKDQLLLDIGVKAFLALEGYNT